MINQPLALVVDDQASHLRLVELMLTKLGCRTLTAEHPRDALELLKSHTPDLIVLDVHLPDLTGIDLAGRIRGVQRLQNVPVLLMTGQKSEAVEEQARWEGVPNVLQKPLQNAAFERIVHQHVPSLHASVRIAS